MFYKILDYIFTTQKLNLKKNNDLKQCSLNNLKNILDRGFYANSSINCHSNLADTIESII